MTADRTESLGSVTVRQMSVSAMDNNVYLVTSASGEHLLVDAADDAPRVLALLAEAGPAPGRLAIVTTHRHQDHHRALAEVVAATGAWTAAGDLDADELPVPVDVRLEHGDIIVVDDAVALDVIALRGHTPGSVALALTEPADSAHPGRVHLFTGDSLFPGGVGKTAGTAAFTSLIDDVEQRLFDRYPDDTVVWPGHGAPTTLGAERPHLAQWRARGW